MGNTTSQTNSSQPRERRRMKTENHKTAVDDLESQHDTAITELQSQHDTAITKLESQHDTLQSNYDTLNESKNTLQSKHDTLQSNYDKLNELSNKCKKDLTVATENAKEAAKQATKDINTLKSSNEKIMNDLKAKHESALKNHKEQYIKLYEIFKKKNVDEINKTIEYIKKIKTSDETLGYYKKATSELLSLKTKYENLKTHDDLLAIQNFYYYIEGNVDNGEAINECKSIMNPVGLENKQTKNCANIYWNIEDKDGKKNCRKISGVNQKYHGVTKEQCI